MKLWLSLMGMIQRVRVYTAHTYTQRHFTTRFIRLFSFLFFHICHIPFRSYKIWRAINVTMRRSKHLLMRTMLFICIALWKPELNAVDFIYSIPVKRMCEVKSMRSENSANRLIAHKNHNRYKYGDNLTNSLTRQCV